MLIELHWALALVKRIREPHEVKNKSFGLGGNRTHDLRIRSTVTLPTELRGRTEKVSVSPFVFLVLRGTTFNIHSVIASLVSPSLSPMVATSYIRHLSLSIKYFKNPHSFSPVFWCYFSVLKTNNRMKQMEEEYGTRSSKGQQVRCYCNCLTE